jgi:hypothetical protein
MFQIDVHKATMQMLVGFDGGGVIAVLPERSMPVLRWLYSCAVRPAMSCMLSAMAFDPVSLTSRWLVRCDNVIEHARPKRFFASKTHYR